MKVPADAMCRVSVNPPRSIREAAPILEWLRDNDLDKTTNKQWKHAKLEALVFEQSRHAVLFKMTWGGR